MPVAGPAPSLTSVAEVARSFHFCHRHVTRCRIAWFGWIVDLILPRRCVNCGAQGDVLCDACVCALRPLTSTRCAHCGAPTAWPVEACRECSGRRLPFVSARAAVAYAGPARPFVRAWKEGGRRRAVALAAELVVAHVERPAADVITYIPPDPIRELQRGHHPAERLATELAARWQCETVPLLRRTRGVARQAGLGLVDRRRNVRNAFVAVAATPERVVLVDDVYTTGATAGAAAGALRAAGSRAVEVVTFARTVR
jgi:predicted amidophosphoribosyltransferase